MLDDPLQVYRRNHSPIRRPKGVGGHPVETEQVNDSGISTMPISAQIAIPPPLVPAIRHMPIPIPIAIAIGMGIGIGFGFGFANPIAKSGLVSPKQPRFRVSA